MIILKMNDTVITFLVGGFHTTGFSKSTEPCLSTEAIYSVYVILTHKIDIKLNAAAFVKFLAFRSHVYSRKAFVSNLHFSNQ